jgi:hypothetical protein
LYPAKVSFITEGEIEIFYNKQTLMTAKPALQTILKVILHPEEEDKCNQENTGRKKSHQIST